MIASRIRKAGNSYVITIPPDEMEARGLRAGQLVGFDPIPVELRPVAPPRLDTDEEADASGDVPHEQIARELDERIARAIATGTFTQTDLDQARKELQQGALSIGHQAQDRHARRR